MISEIKLKQCIDNCNFAGDIERDLKEYNQAAIMVIFLLSENDSEEKIIVIKRKNNLRQHAGQIAFPGGKIEKKDKSLMETAFRETQEEINIFKKDLKVMGYLPFFYTGTGYAVRPYIAFLKNSIDLENKITPCFTEVEKIFIVEAKKLLSPSNHKRIKAPKNSKMEMTWKVEYENENIWGLTARILVTISAGLNLREFPPCDDI
ncbi:MAG: coenzyme A pyrophosphatase [SAR116 cluster bacterium]|jgi:8-oxo-dGTP pyrophosphatase MutT (NUDIX family)|nr:coenzyme A pyrophosphatase [SAR116 cluster bacterium]|tara:strand:+ start:1058 stop:1672 length:615 start_codon:yes stop_codon:yes gene_type:complete